MYHFFNEPHELERHVTRSLPNTTLVQLLEISFCFMKFMRGNGNEFRNQRYPAPNAMERGTHGITLLWYPHYTVSAPLENRGDTTKGWKFSRDTAFIIFPRSTRARRFYSLELTTLLKKSVHLLSLYVYLETSAEDLQSRRARECVR